MNEFSILIVEDHAGFAQALLNMLSQNQSLNVVEVAKSAEDAIERLPGLNVDLILVDYSLPNMSGINLVKDVHEKYPNLRCAILSGHLSIQHARRALEAGARGYLIKDNPAEIMTGIQRILNGEIYVSKEIRDMSSTDLQAGLV